jgi:hypothetical protein
MVSEMRSSRSFLVSGRPARHNPGDNSAAPAQHERVQATPDSFRALARSSPWRWRTLHATFIDERGVVEAWVRRPGEMLVRRDGEPDQYESGVPYATSVRTAGRGPVPVQPQRHLPHEVAPSLRPDGLVAERPADPWIDYDDPMYRNYQWVAMLDPVELSHHVAIGEVRSADLVGREVWWARVRPEEGYSPRCSCCALLWSEITARDEYGDEPDRLARFAAEGYPSATDVALDLQTGVVVRLEPIGGTVRSFRLLIHEVDADVDAVFAGLGPR